MLYSRISIKSVVIAFSFVTFFSFKVCAKEGNLKAGLIYQTQTQLSSTYTADQSLIQYIKKLSDWVFAVSLNTNESYTIQIVSDDIPFVKAFIGNQIAISHGLLLSLETEAELSAAICYGLAKAKYTDSRTVIGTALKFQEASDYDLYAFVSLFLKLQLIQEAEQVRRQLITYRSKRALKINRAKFQQMTASLKNYQEAFSHFQKASSHYQSNITFEQALVFANAAIKAEPTEAIFYKLRGDLYLQENKYDLAIKDYDKALQLNPNFDTVLLAKAVTFSKTNDTEQSMLNLHQYKKTIS